MQTADRAEADNRSHRVAIAVACFAVGIIVAVLFLCRHKKEVEVVYAPINITIGILVLHPSPQVFVLLADARHQCAALLMGERVWSNFELWQFQWTAESACRESLRRLGDDILVSSNLSELFEKPVDGWLVAARSASGADALASAKVQMVDPQWRFAELTGKSMNAAWEEIPRPRSLPVVPAAAELAVWTVDQRQLRITVDNVELLGPGSFRMYFHGSQPLDNGVVSVRDGVYVGDWRIDDHTYSLTATTDRSQVVSTAVPAGHTAQRYPTYDAGGTSETRGDASLSASEKTAVEAFRSCILDQKSKPTTVAAYRVLIAIDSDAIREKVDGNTLVFHLAESVAHGLSGVHRAVELEFVGPLVLSQSIAGLRTKLQSAGELSEKSDDPWLLDKDFSERLLQHPETVDPDLARELAEGRKAQGADAIVIVGGSEMLQGLDGYSIVRADPGTAMAIVVGKNATIKYTTLHEIGHLLGARHERECSAIKSCFAKAPPPQQCGSDTECGLCTQDRLDAIALGSGQSCLANRAFTDKRMATLMDASTPHRRISYFSSAAGQGPDEERLSDESLQDNELTVSRVATCVRVASGPLSKPVSRTLPSPPQSNPPPKNRCEEDHSCRLEFPRLMVETVYFDFDVWEVERMAGMGEQLAQFSRWAKRNHIHRFFIDGYADRVGSSRANEFVSWSRAANVARDFHEQGFETLCAGHSFEEPDLPSGGTKARRNRSVEIRWEESCNGPDGAVCAGQYHQCEVPNGSSKK